MELARAHTNVIYQIKRALDETNGSDPAEALDKIRNAIATPA
jgi:hypothetical protein